MLDEWLSDDQLLRRPQLVLAAWRDRQGHVDIAVEIATAVLETETDHDIRRDVDMWRGVVTSPHLRWFEDTIRQAHQAAASVPRIRAEHNRPRADPPAPRRAAPTLTQTPMGGFTEQELVTAVELLVERRKHRPYDSELDASFLPSMERGDALQGNLVGRIVHDEYGRLGVRDETTGKTILFDRGSISDFRADEFAGNLGQPLHVRGVVRGWGRDLTTISVTSVFNIRVPASRLNHGLRLDGVTAEFVVGAARRPPRHERTL